MRRVDAGLAADRGIDLRQERGRDLHEVHAAPRDRRGKAGEVADHAAAEREDDVAALELGREQSPRRPRRDGAAIWSPRRRARRSSRMLSPAASSDAVSRGNCSRATSLSVTMPKRRPGNMAFSRSPGALEQVVADEDVVGPLAERHVDRVRFSGHGRPRRAADAQAGRRSRRWPPGPAARRATITVTSASA